jgi:chromatin assembly factor 1 subunit B
MKTYTPVIYWYDKSAAITATDIQQVDVPAVKKREVERNCERYYKLVTVGYEHDVRIWEYCWDKSVFTCHVDFIAQLEGHQKSINCCKFSPNGEMLATGDSDGALIVWEFSEEEIHIDSSADLEFPPNKENWKMNRKVRYRHDGDVNCLCWSPDSKFIATGSADNSVAVHDTTTGRRIWELRNFRNFPVGITWDPHGKYLVTCSTDRRLDIIDAKRGHRMRNIHTITGLNCDINGHTTNPEVPYKMFHDSQLVAFTRAVEFSPCGSLLFVPTAHLEISDSNVYGTYVIRRSDFDSCRPHALLPSTKPTVFVRCSPIVYELLDEEENFLGLPYRVIYGVLTKESITFYDTQHCAPIMYLDNLHYDVISGFSWAPDGKNVVISSHEGFNTFISDFEHEFGKRIELPQISEEAINILQRSKNNTKEEKSAKKRKDKEPKEMEDKSNKKVKEMNVKENKKEVQTPKTTGVEKTTPKKTVKTDTALNGTPKTGNTSLLKFFTPVAEEKQVTKAKKRIETIMLE